MSKSLVLKRRLNERQTNFIQFIASGKSPKRAAKLAGYRAYFPYLDAFLTAPHVQDLIDNYVKALLRAKDKPRSRQVLADIMENPKSGANNRIAAAKILMENADKPRETAIFDKSPSEMSGDELRRSINKLQGELVQRSEHASIIDADPAETAAQLLDIFE